MARIYKQSAIYDARAASIRNLWEPSTEYNGKPSTPNHLITIVMKKTRTNWFEEPALADFTQSCKALYDAAMSHIPFSQVEWPIKDGDMPDAQGRQADWRTGNWILNGSSTSPIEVFINQGGGVVLPLPRRDRVKPGDYVSVTTSVAVKVGDPRGVKCYINKVVFQGEGEEILMGNSASMNELMVKAKEQGLNVTGYGSGSAPQTGFSEGFGTRQAPPNSPVQAPFPSNGNGFAPPPIGFPQRQ